MKLLPVGLAVSALLNAAFVAAFSLRPSLAPAPLQPWFRADSSSATGSPANASAPPQRAPDAASADAAPRAQLWAALDAADLPTLVARLRAAGFPPIVIRGIVSARIEEQFATRMQALRRTLDDTPYWQPSPTHYTRSAKFFEEQSQIYRERSRLMREVLGDAFFATGEVSAAQRRQFGDLPKSKIDLIQRITDDYAEMISQVRAAAQGMFLPEDREKLAFLERERRADLASVLSPQELEDYEMRTSPTTSRLRNALTIMDATEAEFRTIYALRKPHEEFLYPTNSAPRMDFNRRSELQAELDASLKSALGEARAAEFARASDYEFQQLAQLAARENLPLTAAEKAFEIRNATSAESVRIRKDTTLSTDQKLVAMKTAADKARVELTAALGAAGASYAASATWLQAISRGTSVEFRGTSTMFSPVAPSPSPPRPPTGSTSATTPSAPVPAPKR